MPDQQEVVEFPLVLRGVRRLLIVGGPNEDTEIVTSCGTQLFGVQGRGGKVHHGRGRPVSGDEDLWDARRTLHPGGGCRRPVLANDVAPQ